MILRFACNFSCYSCLLYSQRSSSNTSKIFSAWIIYFIFVFGKIRYRKANSWYKTDHSKYVSTRNVILKNQLTISSYKYRVTVLSWGNLDHNKGKWSNLIQFCMNFSASVLISKLFASTMNLTYTSIFVRIYWQF